MSEPTVTKEQFLEKIKNALKIDDSEYQKFIEQYYKIMDPADDYISSEYYFTCYSCGNDFKKIDNTAQNVLFRYKPHKSNWRDEPVCEACFIALQNVNFEVFSEGMDGYPGVLTAYKNYPGFYYKDLRDLSGWGSDFENPDED